ncbi:DUF5801 repeats-in-toxin domain-containing protein [Methylobacterium sp. CB376]|uniref:DUF5801 repeats-in-toxin domain-containing protein n=1 Tax=Methylobacterium sp. CB376 TaxID=3138063 RepID=UPI0024B2119B|nr:DUF5801 repeats-in-toxin domain-containing protein [Methylobacterium nodulans]WFT82649.1 DUF5801 repeats-in-toxin domain-containing protein [Methylobacterium nodulans]
MALDLVAQDIIIDETTGLQDNDVNPSLPPHSTNTTLSYLLGLDGPGGLASPEVAFKANFVQATASAGETITSVTLSQNLAGNAFSTTVGVNSGIRTVDGNYVWLFQDATHANVVIGVIGTSDPAAAPAATGPLAFSFALLNTSNTNADLYTVQYVPLLHPDATNPDDRIDLTDKVFASVAGTSVANFSGQNAPPGINQFYLLDSSNDASKQILVTGFLGTANATPNVSTQGFGVDNQSINPTETLQVDFVTGGTLHAGSASQIQYSSHLETITQAGFTINQITPSNPNLRVDIKISAFNVQGNEQGLNFYDGSPTTTAPITSLKLTGQSGFASPITANGTYATGSGNVTVSGLGTNVVTITGLDNITTVDVTTGSPMDRLTVTGVDANEGCDITEFHFTTQTSNAYTEQVGSFINFDDDGPSISTTGTEPTLTVDETVLATDDTKSFAANFSPAFGADGAGAVTYALSAIAGPSGLVDTATNQAVNLSLNGSVVEGRTAVGNDLVFTVSVDASGNVTLDQKRAVVHANANDANDAATLAADNLVQLTATVTDKDGDHQAATLNIGQNLSFLDDGPTITAQFDADPATPGIQTPEHLGNAVGQTATGTFGYDIGHDSHPATFYDATHSDFVDTNPAVPGIQIGLTGTVDNTQNPNITQAVATLTSESATSATFNFSFHYDKDPLTAGVQDSTAGGTLVFDKVAGTYTFTLTDVIDGFSFDVLHTSELVSKQPTGNTGHPLIVAEQLTPNGDPDPFFVQFTGNSVTQQIGFGFNSTGDGAPSGPPTDVSFTQGAHELVTNVNEDWVSATQSTNGVAGDTIQKGELLTMRFFKENILSDVDPSAPGGGTERLDPTTSASGVVIKFDGIGSSEDLILILDLKNAAGNEITRAVNVQNSDLIKGNANIPAPYNTEFTLDNNDALLIIEQNDYTVAGETYQIQGIQIMQSANGLTGNAIDLNGATGANGGSSATSNLTAWDPTDNDVLKITDIGFVQQTSGTINANLDFSLALVDADGDATATQHINVNISNAFIV